MTKESEHYQHAMALAQAAIEHDASSNLAEARQAWQTASDYADRHLGGERIDYWIKGGLGSALYQVGDYDGAVAASRLAMEPGSNKGAVLPYLTIARAALKNGDPSLAAEHVRNAHRLIGDNVFKQLEAEYRDAMRAAIPDDT